MEDRFAYGLNPKKLGVVSAYLCDPASAPAEFLLTKSQYQAETGRAVERGACSFRSGRRSYPARSRRRRQTKSAMKRPCAGQRASTSFSFVPTSTRATFTITFITTPQPRTAPGSFITSSAPALRCGGSLTGCASSMSCPSFKIRNSTARAAFFTMASGTGKKPPSAQQRVRLAIVEALGQRPADFPAFLRLMEESGFQVKHGRGGAISFLAPGQDKYTRLRASTLGPGFDPDDIRAVIAGSVPSRSSRRTARLRPGVSI